MHVISLSIYGPAGAPSLLVAQPMLVVTELTTPLPNIDVLIGLDLLGESLFILNGREKQFILGF